LCGTPVIVSDDCGCGEVIGRTGGGRVVAEGSRRALTDAMDSILAEPNNWRQAAEAAREKVRVDFAADGVFHRLDRLYQEMVGERN
jgi:glycosyltransferase involved in cell wall biosynthesis